jgi:hypothetical protein
MNKVRSYTTDQLLNHAKSINGFKSFPKNKWIYGVRSNEKTPNVPDDKFYFFEEEKFITMLTGSTEPGTPILEGGFLKYNKVGAAVVKANEWYHNLWLYGLHMGKMPALRQVGDILLYRDGDMDVYAEELGKLIKGNYFGINFHTMDYNLLSKDIETKIGTWSAGCQIANQVEKYYQTISSFKNNGLTTYLLVDEFEPK